MFWYIPSWLEYLSVWKVLAIAAYVLGFALVESLVMLGFVFCFMLLFPARIFRGNYTALGSSLAALISIGAVMIQRQISLVYRLDLWQVVVYPFAGLIGLALFTLLLAWVFNRFSLPLRIVNSLAERMTVFAYLYVPLGAIGVLVVVVRNLLGQ